MQQILELFLSMCSLSTVPSVHVTLLRRRSFTFWIVWVIVSDMGEPWHEYLTSGELASTGEPLLVGYKNNTTAWPC